MERGYEPNRLCTCGRISCAEGAAEGTEKAEKKVADVEHIPGVEAGSDGAVEGVLPDEVQGAPLEGIDLVVDEDVSRAGQGEQELVVVVEMEAAHVPGHIVIQL